jgi:three-Cys-motif partner protein
MTVYNDREQTQSKHFILRRYLQELAFKVLRGWDVVYVDGFSGPWQSKTGDFSDTSFMIAIGVLKDAQKKIEEQTGTRRKVKCFLSEKNAKAYAEMVAAVAPFHQPSEKFEIKTFEGEFVDAVAEISSFIGSGFPLIFRDPTGWTEYPLDKIAPLFSSPKCETLVNFMYGHISRFPTHPDPKIIASLDPILGGPGRQARLDPKLKKGLAMEKLFRENLKDAGKFSYVVSTKVDKITQDRPAFFLVYGTKNRAGLIAFRDTEYTALKEHAKNRSAAKSRKREARDRTGDLWANFEAEQREASIDDLVAEQKSQAKELLLDLLSRYGSLRFTSVVDGLLQAFMLRETNVKDVCVDLAHEGKLQNTWGTGIRKPREETIIKLVGAS